MMRLKNTVSFMCILGTLLGQGGFCSCLAMEEDGEEAAGVRTSIPASRDEETPVKGNIVLSGPRDATVSVASMSNDDRLTSLMYTLAAHQRLPVNPGETPVDKRAFCFVTIPSQHNGIEGLTNSLPSTVYKITAIKNSDSSEMTSMQRGALEELGKALFAVLPERSGHLGWADFLEGRDYPMGPFSNTSSIKSTHLFFSDPRHKRSTLEEYLREGVCWVGRHLTILKGVPRLGEREVQLHAETSFSPIQCTLAGLFYVINPKERKTFLLFLAESPLFARPQFIWMGEETLLEERSWANLPKRKPGQEAWRALSNWIYVNPTESPFYSKVGYHISSPTYEYNEDWWRDWVAGSPESDQVVCFLRNFEESLLGRPKEKHLSIEATIVESERHFDGFFQVLSTFSLRGGNYGYVGSDEKLYAAERCKLTLRGEGHLIPFSVTAYKKGSTYISPENTSLVLRGLSSSSLIPLNEGEARSEEEEGTPRRSQQRGFYEISKAGNEERMHMRPQNGPVIDILTNGFRIQKKGDENASLPEVLRAGTLEYVSVVHIEDCLIPKELMPSLPDIMSDWQYLKELTFRRCFNENNLDNNTAQPFFNALRGLRTLEKLDFSGNLSEMDVFRALLLTLLGDGPENLTHMSLSLPNKPRVDGKRATLGGMVGSGAALGGLIGGVGGSLPGLVVGTLVGGGGAAGGAFLGGASRRVNEFSRRNTVSKWTVAQIEPLMNLHSLKTVEIFGVRRWEKGRSATRQALEDMRHAMDLPPLTITIHRAFSDVG